MKSKLRIDSWVTIVGLTVLVAAFLIGAFLPERKRVARVRREIAETEQAIRDIPVRLAELELLERQINDRREHLNEAAALVPAETEMHVVLNQVARLAADADLTVTRLEPLPAVPYASYRAVPFRISFSGPFRGIALFLQGLESRPRLVAVEELSLKGEPAGSGDPAQGDVYFVVYARNADPAGSAENNTRSAGRATDRGIR